jgi:hypothetical protein
LGYNLFLALDGSVIRYEAALYINTKYAFRKVPKVPSGSGNLIFIAKIFTYGFAFEGDSNITSDLSIYIFIPLLGNLLSVRKVSIHIIYNK